ncbi:hypothetical protein [Leekyejoonella antrihumi]|uniref:hypothetical protein n=1 Tax=Leekyejoonella antrihumi TaxID=1660198 RepID=UPI0016486C49|nr:hypothetical protein [Leekyejoonella antrihumi]
MAIDSVRAALQVVTGAGELTRTKALEAAGGLLAIPGVGPTAARATQAAGQVSTLADELIAAAAANREMMRDLVRQELEAQLQRLGLTTTSELGSAQDEIDRLKVELAQLKVAVARVGDDQRVQATTTAVPAPTRPRRAAMKKAAAPAKTTTSKKATSKKATAKKATKKAPAKRTTAKKATND